MLRIEIAGRAWLGACTLLLLAGAGCGDDADAPSGGGEPDAGETAGDAGERESDAAYLYTLKVYGQDSTLQYAVVRDSIDFDITVQDLEQAREFAGYAGVSAIGGQVVVGDQETPFASRFDIAADLSWKQVGDKLNF